VNLLSNQFAIFLVITFVLFYASPAKVRPLLLLAANFLFYGLFSIPILTLIVACSSVDFFLSKAIYRCKVARQRTLLLWCGIFYNCFLLVFFKYFNWLVDSAVTVAHAIGIECGAAHVQVLLPLGISFYTLEAISYLVDVYRGMAPAKKWWHYNFYMMWFPHLIAGPIVRFIKVSDQYIHGIDRTSCKRLKEGFVLILFGCFCKLVVADFAATIADPVFTLPSYQNSLTAFAGFTAFGTQLLFDFWGYSQIARGVSLLFNIELPINFNRPFTATNVADFWQRWHISLSQWLHDYIFLPLGGRSRKIPKTLFAVAITMLAAGLWHGAETKYLALGIYFAVCISCYHVYRRYRRRLCGGMFERLVKNRIYHSLSWVLTQWYVVTGASFLRVSKLDDLWILQQKLFSGPNFLRHLSTSNEYHSTIFCLALFWAASWIPFRRWYEKYFVNAPMFLQAPGFASVLVLCWICAAQTPKPFIYFNF
jgi:alginate O-acetyltransferase complex protein AlgI